MIGRIIAIGFTVLILAYGIWWLWQRQPKPQINKDVPISSIESVKPKETQNFQFSPKDLSVLTSKDIELEGKVEKNSFVAILSNSFSHISKSDNEGQFKADLKLQEGLNLVSVVIFSNESKETNSYQLSYFLTKDQQFSAFQVVNGPVKNIFDRVMTIAAPSGEINVKIEKNTTIDIPLDKTEATSSPVNAIRIGDYAISLGNLKEQSQTAAKIQILREDKPQIASNVIITTLLSTVKKDIFSASILNDSKINEYTLSKNSQILENGIAVNSKKIEKNKKAIIIFSDDKDKKNVNLIYLLP